MIKGSAVMLNVTGEWATPQPKSKLCPELQQLVDLADLKGVSLCLFEHADGIELEYLGRDPLTPKGFGAIVLASLVAYADRSRRTIDLYVIDKPLVRYYRAFGFRVTSKTGSGSSWAANMIREPQQ